ncbi:hypothetical protein MMO41_09825 [Acinetobacter sp. ANC 5442]|nr:hypothetical protein [Acinetobacter higginsii]MCH7295607.1 hypothetical protein [Acinetobacter higginsii]
MKTIMNSDLNEKDSPFAIILKGFPTFGLIFIFSGFYLGLSVELYSYTGLNIDNIALAVWYITYFYVAYLFGFCILKQVYIRNKDNICFDKVRILIYFLLASYYFLIFPRYYFLDGTHDLYGFRFMLGFIYPFWILTPLFFSNSKFKFNVYLCIVLCIVEIIFWILFFKVNFSDFYKRSTFVSVMISSLIFTLTFSWYLSWLQKIDVDKWVAPFFLKQERIISKILSWIAMVLGGLFMFLFYLTF